MSNAQHTPGPWHVGTNKEAGAAGTTNLPVWGPDGQATCWVEDRGGERCDNAHLIAAAPEMLARLQEAEYALSKYPEHSEYGDAGVPSTLLQSIRAAIAKATGGAA